MHIADYSYAVNVFVTLAVIGFHTVHPGKLLVVV